MTHPTIEKMALELCRRAGTCNPHLYEDEAKATARILLTAEPSEAEIFATASAMYENGYYCHGPEISKINDATRAALKAARAALMKEMGL